VFFGWYNQEHRHTGLGLMTPETVHYGRVESVRRKRQEVLDAAYAAHPERFVGGRPTPPQLPKEVWINQPTKEHDEVSHSVGSATSGIASGAQAEASHLTFASPDESEYRIRVKRIRKEIDKSHILHSKLQPEVSQSC
jgi:hypothetical protein